MLVEQYTHLVVGMVLCKVVCKQAWNHLSITLGRKGILDIGRQRALEIVHIQTIFFSAGGDLIALVLIKQSGNIPVEWCVDDNCQSPIRDLGMVSNSNGALSCTFSDDLDNILWCVIRKFAEWWRGYLGLTELGNRRTRTSKFCSNLYLQMTAFPGSRRTFWSCTQRHCLCIFRPWVICLALPF